MSNMPAVVIDCERMKYPHTGLYQFCMHLAQALIEANTSERLCFYTPASATHLLTGAECIIRQRAWHKQFFPSVKNVAVWHCTHQGSAYFPFNKPVKKLLTHHDLNYLHDPSKSEAKKKIFRIDLQRKINEADAIAAISHHALTDLKQHFNLQGKNCSVIYNGCTIHEISTLAPPALAPMQPFLFTIGAITPKKNFHVLPRLLAGNKLMLLIAGIAQNKTYKQKIIAEATLHGVADRVHFTGPVSENDKQWYLKNCRAFVFPSLAEGFGLPVVEAMYFGRPLLLSTSTSLPEIGGSEASYFSGFEMDAMQQALNDCLHRYDADPLLSIALKKRAALFSWQEAAENYLALYAALRQGE